MVTCVSQFNTIHHFIGAEEAVIRFQQEMGPEPMAASHWARKTEATVSIADKAA